MNTATLDTVKRKKYRKPVLNREGKIVRQTKIETVGIGRVSSNEGIDMVAALGADFGCVQSGDRRTVKQKLTDFGRRA
ncbi:MAG: hypothetical protein LBK99_22170 [Opitutaceae bacterium]|jgi:hypothetical protein|nr:hypothetical protein [Opitutaceae bacterium]